MNRILSPARGFIGKLALLGMALCLSPGLAAQQADRGWIPLFNGRDLSNWLPKFSGHPLGENYRNTFRVEDGVLKVSYDNWPAFNGEFGHLFYDRVFSHYLLRVEYRFTGEQLANGPAWALRNNGLMLHSQDPRSMTADQEFPVSIEVQLLGGTGTGPRPTANVCSPGTHYVFRGELFTPHCQNSSSATYEGDQWVSLELEVRGDDLVRHRLDGEVVFEYGGLQLDPADPDAQRLLADGHGLSLGEGYISIQAETHPTEFRKIEILPLSP